MNNPANLLPLTPHQRVVLVVDDEVLILNIARIALEREGYFVLTAENGEEAMELSRKFPGTIHAIVSDIQMPKMDGIELRKRIITERLGIRVLLMSGQVDPLDDTCPFLPKPFQLSDLRERVKHLFPTAASA